MHRVTPVASTPRRPAQPTGPAEEGDEGERGDAQTMKDRRHAFSPWVALLLCSFTKDNAATGRLIP